MSQVPKYLSRTIITFWNLLKVEWVAQVILSLSKMFTFLILFNRYWRESSKKISEFCRHWATRAHSKCSLLAKTRLCVPTPVAIFRAFSARRLRTIQYNTLFRAVQVHSKRWCADLDTNEERVDQAGNFRQDESSQKNKQKPKLLTSLSPRRATLPTSQLTESWDWVSLSKLVWRSHC